MSLSYFSDKVLRRAIRPSLRFRNSSVDRTSFLLYSRTIGIWSAVIAVLWGMGISMTFGQPMLICNHFREVYRDLLLKCQIRNRSTCRILGFHRTDRSFSIVLFANS